MDEIIIIYVALAVVKILPVFLKGNTSIIKLIIEADKIKFSILLPLINLKFLKIKIKNINANVPAHNKPTIPDSTKISK